MRTVDEIGRIAGAQLRAWDAAGIAPPPPREIARRADRRRRRQQRVAVAAVVLVVGVGGVAWFQSLDGNTGLATGSEATPSSETPVVPAPTPTPAGPAPTPTPTPTPTPSVEVACTASFPYDPTVVYDVGLPEGWFAYEAEVEPGRGGRSTQRDACIAFGPNAAAPAVALSIRVEERHGQTFDEMVANMSAAPTTVSTQQTTVDGHPAARFEVVIAEGDLAYVHWQVDVGDRWLSLSTISADEQTIAGLDAIVANLRIRTVG